jgi:hypothetical protein
MAVNCHARNLADWDTHIELVLDPMNTRAAKRMIVEVTPSCRVLMMARGADWSTRALRDKFLGRWVKVTGWVGNSPSYFHRGCAAAQVGGFRCRRVFSVGVIIRTRL